MSSSKAMDEEQFYVELFKHGLHAIYCHLVDLFNHVVRTSFLKPWSHHIIHLIYKPIPSVDPNNYRTIMVEHNFSKLYATVLHMQFFGNFEQRHLKAKGQDGFKRAHQTIDHILAPLAIIEKESHLSSEVYCCFVNFRKALDFDPKVALFQKL